MKLTKTSAILFIITSLGAILRVFNLGFRLPDGDETFTLYVAQFPVTKIISYSLLTDNNPPLFYLVAHLATAIAGISAAVARIPSVIFGILLIPMMYLIGVELEDEHLGLLSAGFTAILYPAIYYSQYARSFAMEGFIFSIVILAFIRILKGKDAWPMFAISGLISLYIHAFAVVPLAFMILYLISIREARWRYLIGMSIGAIPFFLMMLIIGMYRHGTFGFSPALVTWFIPIELFGYAYPLVIALGIWAWFRYWSRYDAPLIGIPLMTCLAVIFLAPFTPVFSRYIMLIMPMFAGIALLPVSRWIKNRNPGVFFIILVFVLLQALQLIWYWSFKGDLI